MSTVHSADQRTLVRTSRSITPIKVWATLGAGAFAFQIYVLIDWITGPYFKTVPVGPDAPPEWMKIAIHTYTAFSLCAFALCMWWFLVRPWVRKRQVTTDGIFAIVWFCLYWFWDPVFNYFNNVFTFNAYAYNKGAWTASIPGWLAPQEPGRMIAEPFLWCGTMYTYALLPGTIFMCWVMRRAQSRWYLGNASTMAVGWILSFVLITVIEIFWMRIGLYSFAGANTHFTILTGKYYQYPLNESLLWGTAWVSMAWLRYFKNDKGQTLVERGLENIKTTYWRATALRFFALLAAGNFCYGVFYTLPQSTIFFSHPDPWPQDILQRSYLTSGGMCSSKELVCPPERAPTQSNPTSK